MIKYYFGWVFNGHSACARSSFHANIWPYPNSQKRSENAFAFFKKANLLCPNLKIEHYSANQMP